MTAYPLPSIQNYENFDLLIDPTADGYQARVINSPVGQAASRFKLDAIDTAQSDPKQVGALLYQTVFSGEVGICLRRSLDDVAQKPNSGLRIRFRLTTVPELATLPWETLYDTKRNHFYAHHVQTPLVRYQALDQGEVPLQTELPLRLLVLISDPANFWPRLDVEHEWEQLNGAMTDPVTRGKVKIERLPARLGLLQQRLQQGNVHLLHFIGHGWYDNAKYNGLVMETESGQADHVAVERLTTLLHDHSTLRLVLLNTCEGARGDHTNAFAGVAQRLVQQGIPAIIAMQKRVSDQSAIALTRTFYQALATGYPVDAALAEARKAIFAINHNDEWSIPVLFSRAVDNKLFDLLDVLPSPPCPYPGMVPFTKNDARFFFGREDEIDELHRRLRHHNQLFVIGPSGSGKSSLVFAGLLPALEKQSTTQWRIRTFRPGATPLAALDEALADRPVVTEATTTASGDDQKFLLVIDQFEELFVQASKADQTTFMARVKALRQEQQVKLLITMRADFYPDLMNSDLWPIDVSQRVEIAPLRGEKLRQAIEQPADAVDVVLEAGLLERLLADAADEPGVLPLVQETMVLLWDAQERRILPLAAYARLGRGGRSGLAVAMATKADATLASLSPEQQHIARRVFLRLVQFGEGRSDTRRQQFLSDLASMSDDDTLLATTLRVLTDNRLVTMDGESDAVNPKVDIAHEMLITHWPTAQDWITHRREAELTRRRLEEKTFEWIRLGRSDSGLLDAVELTEAERWVQSTDAIDLGYSKQLAMLVQRSRNTLEQAAKEREAVRNRELAQTQAVKQKNAQLRHRAWVLSIVGILAIVAALGAGLFGVRSNQLSNELDGKVQEISTQATAVALERDQKVAAQKTASWSERIALTRKADAEQQAQVARSRQLAAQAIALPTRQLDLALLLSLEAYRIEATAEARNALFTIMKKNAHLLQFLHLNDSYISAMAFSPNGKLLALGNKLFDISSKESAIPLELQITGDLLAFSPDSKLVAVMDADNQVLLWDTSNPRLVTLMGKLPLLHNERIVKLQFSPNNSKLLAAIASNRIQLLDLSDPQSPQLVEKEFEGEYAAFSNNGLLLAVSSEKVVRLWDMSNFNSPKQLAANKKIIGKTLSFSPNDSLLATSINGMVSLWDVTAPENPNLVHELTHLEIADDIDLTFSPYNILFASSKAGSYIYSWDISNPKLPNLLAREPIGYGVTVSSNNKLAWVIGDSVAFINESTIMLKNLGDYDFDRGSKLIEYGGMTNFLQFSLDGSMLVSYGGYDHNAILWNTSDLLFPKLQMIPDESLGYKRIMTNDSLLTYSNNVDRLWDISKFIPISGTYGIHNGVLSPKDNLLALLIQDNVVHVLEISDLEHPKSIGKIFTNKRIALLKFRDDGKMLATVSEDEVIHLWDVSYPADPTLLTKSIKGNNLVFSPDKRILVSFTSQNEANLWNISDPRMPLQIQVIQNVSNGAISPDGKIFAVIGYNSNSEVPNTVKLWDIHNSASPILLTGLSLKVPYSMVDVYQVAFSPDGTLLAIGIGGGAPSREGELQLWDVSNYNAPMLLGDPLDNFGAVSQIVFSKDGKKLISKGLFESWINVWDTDILAWQVRACQIANRNFTNDEWQSYMENEPYRKTCPYND